MLLFISIQLLCIRFSSAISYSTLEHDYQKLQKFQARSQPNIFGIRFNSSSSSLKTPVVNEKFETMDKLSKKSHEMKAKHRLSDNIHPILVYGSQIQPKFEVKITQIRKIRRVGGGYPYGPKNNSICDLKEPIFVVHRYIWDADSTSYTENTKVTHTTTWTTFNETIEFPFLPYRLMSASVECQYCFAYWKRQPSFQPNSIYSRCCTKQTESNI